MHAATSDRWVFVVAFALVCSIANASGWDLDTPSSADTDSITTAHTFDGDGDAINGPETREFAYGHHGWYPSTCEINWFEFVTENFVTATRFEYEEDIWMWMESLTPAPMNSWQESPICEGVVMKTGVLQIRVSAQDVDDDTYGWYVE